jgi:hypothetical protein
VRGDASDCVAVLSVLSFRLPLGAGVSPGGDAEGRNPPAILGDGGPVAA